MSFVHPISLPSSLSISPHSFASLSLISLLPFHMCSIVSLSPHSTVCTFFPLLPSNTCFCFFCILSPQILWNFSSVILLILPLVSGFFDSLPSFLLICVFVPFTQLHIHPSSFCSQSFHFFTGIPVPLVVFLSLLLRFFFFSPAFRKYPALFSSIHFVLKLCRSLSRFHSKPISLAFFPHYVTWRFSIHSWHPSQIFFLHSLYLLLYQYTLDHALKHLHSLLFPTHIPLYLVCLPHYNLMCALSVVLSLNVYPKYLNSFTRSIFLPSQFHSFSLLFFLFLLLNTIIFVFSTFTCIKKIALSSSHRYFLRFFIISFISLSLFAAITKSANARLQTFSLPTPTPPLVFSLSFHPYPPHIINSKGLNEQPCLTPFVYYYYYYIVVKW
jgi:hypothetical protein